MRQEEGGRQRRRTGRRRKSASEKAMWPLSGHNDPEVHTVLSKDRQAERVKKLLLQGCLKDTGAVESTHHHKSSEGFCLVCFGFCFCFALLFFLAGYRTLSFLQTFKFSVALGSEQEKLSMRHGVTHMHTNRHTHTHIHTVATHLSGVV